MYFDTTTDPASSLETETWILDPDRSNVGFSVPLLYGKVGTVKGVEILHRRGAVWIERLTERPVARGLSVVRASNESSTEHLSAGGETGTEAAWTGLAS